MIYNMKLQNEPFISIKNGTKKIEMRLNDEKRKNIKINDVIIFTNISTNEELIVNVVGLHYFNDFKELYNFFDKKYLGYSSDEPASYLDMTKYYDSDNIKKYGVVGIEIVLK